MLVRSVYREAGDAPQPQDPRTVVSRHVRIVLGVDSFITRIADTVVRIKRTIDRRSDP